MLFVFLFLLHLDLQLLPEALHRLLHLYLLQPGRRLCLPPPVPLRTRYELFSPLLRALQQRPKPAILRDQLRPMRDKPGVFYTAARKLLLERGAKVQSMPL